MILGISIGLAIGILAGIVIGVIHERSAVRFAHKMSYAVKNDLENIDDIEIAIEQENT